MFLLACNCQAKKKRANIQSYWMEDALCNKIQPVCLTWPKLFSQCCLYDPMGDDNRDLQRHSPYLTHMSDSHRVAVYIGSTLWMLIFSNGNVHCNKGQIHLSKIRSEWCDAAHNVKRESTKIKWATQTKERCDQTTSICYSCYRML